MPIQKYPGNISILALLVLLASALIGVFVALTVKNFITYSDRIDQHQKANYLAKAGTELGLAIVGSREFGLEFELHSGSTIMENFSCPKATNNTCLDQAFFSLNLSGLNQVRENCEKESIKVWPWRSKIIPLFKDQGFTSVKEGLEKWGSIAIAPDFELKDWKLRRFWLASLQGEELTLKALDNPRISGIPLPSSYLIIINPSWEEQELCLTSDTIPFPQETIRILSIGNFKDTQLARETLISKKLPSFLEWDNYLE